MNSLKRFIINNPVFTFKEVHKELKNQNTVSTVRTRIHNLIKSGRINNIGRRGLYYSIPDGRNPNEYIADRFLIASKLYENSIIGFHSAFELLGYANKEFMVCYSLAIKQKPKLKFKGIMYRSILLQKSLHNNTDLGIKKIERNGIHIKVTSPERTLVDCLDKLRYSGGPEELYNCTHSLPYLDTELILAYLKILNKKLLYAKVGLFLEMFGKHFLIKHSWFDKLERYIPNSPTYFYVRQKNCKYNSRWNLLVPESYRIERYINNDLQ